MHVYIFPWSKPTFQEIHHHHPTTAAGITQAIATASNTVRSDEAAEKTANVNVAENNVGGESNLNQVTRVGAILQFLKAITWRLGLVGIQSAANALTVGAIVGFVGKAVGFAKTTPFMRRFFGGFL